MKLIGTESITCLGVLLDKNSTWKPHIKYIIKSKTAKNIRLLFKANQF